MPKEKTLVSAVTSLPADERERLENPLKYKDYAIFVGLNTFNEKGAA